MYPGGLIREGDTTSYYDSDYVRTHSMCHAKGVGNIFIEKARTLSEYGTSDLINLTPSHIYENRKLFVQTVINTCLWQIWLVDFHPSLDRLSREQKKGLSQNLRQGIQINKMLINYHKKLL